MSWLGLTLLLLAIPAVQPLLRSSTAASLGVCLRAIGLAASVQGVMVAFPPAGGFEIITECTAIYIIPVFAAAVLAAPVAGREKLVALGWGIPFLFGVNLLRLVVLALVMIHWPTAFNFFHEYLWQVLFASTVIVAWWLWCESVLRKSPTPRPRPQAAS